MRISLLDSLLLFTASVACGSTSCDSIAQRQGIQKLVEAFREGTDESIAQVPATENVTSIIEIQGIPILLGTNKEEGGNAIRLVHTITTAFTPDPYDLSSYFVIGDNQAFINGTTTLGGEIGDLKLGTETVPATQNFVYDLDTCLGYLAVGTVSPVSGTISNLAALVDALLQQGFTIYDGPLLSLL